jgi:hypothetical protein
MDAGQQFDSPALNAGDPNTLVTLANELRQLSTATNGALDTGSLDLGFHFPP